MPFEDSLAFVEELRSEGGEGWIREGAGEEACP